MNNLPKENVPLERLINSLKDKSAMAEFERQYQLVQNDYDNLRAPNIKDKVSELKSETNLPTKSSDFNFRDSLIEQLVMELKPLIKVNIYDPSLPDVIEGNRFDMIKPLNFEQLSALPQDLAPQATGLYMKKDVNVSDEEVQQLLETMLEKDSKNHYLQGLSILDYTPYIWDKLNENENTFSYWFPKLVEASKYQSFFKIPKTKWCTLPIQLAQLGRIEYGTLTSTTKEMFNKLVYETFELDDTQDYFIKTGLRCFKFDFRNARVSKGKETHEIGEYFLYLAYEASSAAGYLSPYGKPMIGLALTNDIVVREWIDDLEDNPTIYQGMPLHTEYRAFVDFDTKELLGIVPYWHPIEMKKSFASRMDNIHFKHDYVVYSAHEEVLNQRYNDNVGKVAYNLQSIINNCELNGRWSLDIMQNGEDFYLIDMATMETSALASYIKNGVQSSED